MDHAKASSPTRLMDMSIKPWLAVNDVVMGGLSSGGMAMLEEGLTFQGYLSLQNNGGFSSVRRATQESFAHSSGIRLTVKGDGRRYQLRLRQDRNFDGIAWRREFITDGSIQLVELPYAEFEPVYRGRTVANAGPLEPDLIRQIGFLIADKTEGAFSLSILKMEIIKQPTKKNAGG